MKNRDRNGNAEDDTNYKASPKRDAAPKTTKGGFTKHRKPQNRK